MLLLTRSRPVVIQFCPGNGVARVRVIASTAPTGRSGIPRKPSSGGRPRESSGTSQNPLESVYHRARSIRRKGFLACPSWILLLKCPRYPRTIPHPAVCTNRMATVLSTRVLFARGIERDVELGVRGALGATRGRIMRELIVEKRPAWRNLTDAEYER